MNGPRHGDRRRSDVVGVDLEVLVAPPAQPRRAATSPAGDVIDQEEADSPARPHGHPGRASHHRRRGAVAALAACAAVVIAAMAWANQRPPADSELLGGLTHAPVVAWSRTTAELLPDTGGDARVLWSSAGAVGTGNALIGTVMLDYSDDETDGGWYLSTSSFRLSSGDSLPWPDNESSVALVAHDGRVLYSSTFPLDGGTPLALPGGLVEWSGTDRRPTATIRSGDTGAVTAVVHLGDGNLVATGGRGDRAYALVSGPGGRCSLHKITVSSGEQREVGDGVGNCYFDQVVDWVGTISVGEDIGVLPQENQVFDLDTGQLLWNMPAGDVALLPGDYLRVEDYNEAANSGLYDATGRLAVRSGCGGTTVVTGTRAGDVVVVPQCSDPSTGEVLGVRAYGAALGEQRWQDERITGVLGAAGGHLLVVQPTDGISGNQTLLSLDPSSGAVQWQAPQPADGVILVGTDGTIALLEVFSTGLVDPDAEADTTAMVVAIDLVDGHTEWTADWLPDSWPTAQLGQAAVVWGGQDCATRWDM